MSLSPCLTKKQITFGSFNNFAKISPAVIHYWSEILNALPESRMILKTNYTIDQESQNYWYELLEKGGIDQARVELLSKLRDGKQHLDFYQHIDIALDTFPYNGTTTTCEALWMGVPVITLAGKTHVSRVGMSLLSIIGLEELIAHSPEEYVQKAVTLAQNLPKLQELRRTLRDKIQVSPLTDGKLIAESLEDAYRQMWQTWCQQIQSDNTVQPAQDVLLKRGQEISNQPRQEIMIESQKLVRQGIQYLQSGKLPQAETCFRQVIQTDSDNVDAWHLLGIVSAQKKEYSQAIEQIRRAIELKPKEALFYKNLANVYQDKGDIEQAIAYYTRVIELAPQWWEAYYSLGILSAQQNDVISAIKFLEQFVKAQPDNIDGYLH